jgi:hypothetical protein
MANLTTAERVQHIKALGDKADVISRLEECLAAASAWFETAVGPILTASYTERLSGGLSPVLKLAHKPCTAVTSLSVNGTTWRVLTSAVVDTGQEVFLPSHGMWLEARGYLWPKGNGNILITYTAGYGATAEVLPDDIQQSVALVTLLLMEESNRLGIGAKTLGPEQINLVIRNAKDYQFITDTINHYGRIY